MTTRHRSDQPDTVPTASATGAPRIFPRHTEQKHRAKKIGERGRRARQRSSSGYDGNGEDSDDDVSDYDGEDDEGEGEEDDEDSPPPPEMTPSGSLTVAAFSPSSGMPVARRAALIASALAINLGLPFVNGVMLGFGEIVARTFLAPWIGVVLGPLMPTRFGFGANGPFGSSTQQQRGLSTARAGLGTTSNADNERRARR